MWFVAAMFAGIVAVTAVAPKADLAKNGEAAIAIVESKNDTMSGN